MNILIFEYITGGGLVDEALPPSLAAEGRMMLQALLDELALLPGLELVLLLDQRVSSIMRLPANAQARLIGPGQAVADILSECLPACDVFWPIAPEMDNILLSIAKMAGAFNTRLLLSSLDAVAVCADKYATYQQLKTHGLPVVATYRLDETLDCPQIVIKPLDGVGCQDSRVLAQAEYPGWRQTLADPQRYIKQAYLSGRSLSLSGLFKHGQAWLLTCNQQRIERVQGQFHLSGCAVNIAIAERGYYQALLERIAQAMPGLWGYVGVDVLETAPGEAQILEINPRLTTSYVGIYPATAINVAEQVLRLAGDLPPHTKPRVQQTVEVTIR